MRKHLSTSLIVILLASASSAALAQSKYTVTSNSGITTSVSSVDYPSGSAEPTNAPVAPLAQPPIPDPDPKVGVTVTGRSIDYPTPQAPAQVVPLTTQSTTTTTISKREPVSTPLVATAMPHAHTQMAPIVEGQPKVVTSTTTTVTTPAPAPLTVVATPAPQAAAPMPATLFDNTPQAAAAPQQQVQTPAAAPVSDAAATGPARSLADIMTQAYTTSPALHAEREVLRQKYEDVAIAESNRRPTLSVDGGVAAVDADTRPGGKDTFFSRDLGITGTQYLYRGGRTLAQIDQQLSLSDAAIAAYDTVTQDVFLNVVTAAMDIQRDRATIDLTEQDRAVIARSLQSAQNGFKVGELTRTDVAQAQARLSGAEAELVNARADYSSALARFKQYAGIDGTTLQIADDIQSVAVPQSLDAAQSTADTDHPTIRTAIQEEKASQSAIKLAQGQLLPDVYAQGSAGKSWDPSSLLDSEADASIGVRASVPLYDGGASRATIRQAKYQQMEKKDRIADARRTVGQQVATAWNDYQAALAQIGARTDQVNAAQIARDGVYKERQVGTRTVLDTLNADEELLDAQVGLVSAHRDAIVAAYALQAATGQLTGEKLGLFHVDSEKAVLDKTRKKWLGTDIQSAD